MSADMLLERVVNEEIIRVGRTAISDIVDIQSTRRSPLTAMVKVGLQGDFHV